MGFDEVISYGNGMVLLFYGPSGTGKTMMVDPPCFSCSPFLILSYYSLSSPPPPPTLGSESATTHNGVVACNPPHVTSKTPRPVFASNAKLVLVITAETCYFGVDVVRIPFSLPFFSLSPPL